MKDEKFKLKKYHIVKLKSKLSSAYFIIYFINCTVRSTLVLKLRTRK